MVCQRFLTDKQGRRLGCSFPTYPLLLVEAHDLHGFQRLIKHQVVLLTRDLHVAGHQEAVGPKVLQEELLCGTAQLSTLRVCNAASLQGKAKVKKDLLTPRLVLGSGHHVVEDVEGSLCVGLTDAARLLQQV